MREEITAQYQPGTSTEVTMHDGSVLRLLAPNRFVIDWVQRHHLERILEVVDDTHAETEVVLEVGSRVAAAGAAASPV